MYYASIFNYEALILFLTAILASWLTFNGFTWIFKKLGADARPAMNAALLISISLWLFYVYTNPMSTSELLRQLGQTQADIYMSWILKFVPYLAATIYWWGRGMYGWRF